MIKSELKQYKVGFMTQLLHISPTNKLSEQLAPIVLCNSIPYTLLVFCKMCIFVQFQASA